MVATTTGIPPSVGNEKNIDLNLAQKLSHSPKNHPTPKMLNQPG
jgi:hypothetical protein